MTLAAGLTRALTRAGIPVTGVSIVSDADRATWRVVYAPEATAQQRTAGEALKLSYDFAADTTGADEELSLAFDTTKMLKAVALTMVDAINIERAQHGRAAITPAVAKANVIDKYKSLP
jgi:hypothetical protein